MTPFCGTSHIFTLFLRCPSSFTFADLSCRKHRIHLYILPETPLSGIFSRRPSRQTLSKAFVRSKKLDWDNDGFFQIAGTVPFFHDSLKSSRSAFLTAGPECLIMSFVTPSGPGAFLHFNCLIATSISFMLMGWLMCLIRAASAAELAALWLDWFFPLVAYHFSLLGTALPGSWLLPFEQLSSPSHCRTIMLLVRTVSI